MITIKNKSFVTIIDFELVASENSLKNLWSDKNDFPEIIEIGCVLSIYDDNKFYEIKNMHQIIKPKLHRELPKYILQLTNKSQKYFESGVDLKEALKKLNKFCKKSSANVSNGIEEIMINVNKTKYGFKLNTPKILNISNQLKIEANKKIVNNHNPVDDCRNVLKKLNNLIKFSNVSKNNDKFIFHNKIDNRMKIREVLDYG